MGESASDQLYRAGAHCFHLFRGDHAPHLPRAQGQCVSAGHDLQIHARVHHLSAFYTIRESHHSTNCSLLSFLPLPLN